LMATVPQVFRFYQRVYQLRRGRLSERNRELFDQSAAVETYRERSGLTPCERYLCEKHIVRGSSVLDVGVGTGRTSTELSARAGDYIGVDYSPAMVETSRERFPELRFEVMNAADLSAFGDGSFEAVVFSYNGIDYLYPDEKRRSFLNEAYRVLSAGGVLIFSTHNARALLAPSVAARGLARRASDAVRGTARRMALYGLQPAAWRGRGYVVDPRYDGLVVHHATPRLVDAEVSAEGFRVVDMAGADYPAPLRPWVTRWVYYVCRRGAGAVQ
jgi:ubiquinone/menaquinone biosynthesis C-methylase UbiE